MTCEDLLAWVESRLGGFDGYDHIEEFQTDLLGAPNKAGNQDGRTANAISKLEDWLEGNLDVDGYDSNTVRGTVLLRQVDAAATEADLDVIEPSAGTLTGPIKQEVQDKIDEKRIELSEELNEIKEHIAAATTQNDLADITVGPLQREYGKKAADEIRALLAEKGEELPSAEEVFQADISSRLDDSTTQEQLDAIERAISDAPSARVEESLLSELNRRRSGL